MYGNGNEVLKRPVNCINKVELICNFVINNPPEISSLLIMSNSLLVMGPKL